MTDYSVGSCFQKINVGLKVAIQPKDTSRPLHAIKAQLNNLLFKYHEELEGLPLSFSDLKLPRGNEYGKFIGDQHLVHLTVLSSIVIFKPQIGYLVQGHVTQISDSNISLLILSLFNAYIPHDNLMRSYSYNDIANQWESSKGDIIKEGDTILFSISNHEQANGVLSIEGTLFENAEE